MESRIRHGIFYGTAASSPGKEAYDEPVDQRSINTKSDAFLRIYRFFRGNTTMAQAPSCRISIVASPGGTVEPGQDLDVSRNTPLEIVAVPRPGYVFACWALVTDSNIAIDDIKEARTVLHARSDGTIEAVFVPRTRDGWTAIAIVLPGLRPQVFTIPIGKASSLTISCGPPRSAAGEWRFKGWDVLAGKAPQLTNPQTTPRLAAKGLASITIEATQGPIVILGGWRLVLDPEPTN